MRRKYTDIDFKMIDVNTSIGNHPGYSTWAMMLQRCYNKNAPDYERYGGRGVTVCKEWKNGPVAFLLWFEENYIEGCTLDRINNDKLYHSDNCKYSTKKEQQNNRRKQSKPTANAKGVSYWKSHKKWGARITIDKNPIFLGLFNTEEEALIERKKAESKYFD